MSVVGSAEIVVRAITNQVKKDIEKAFKDARPVAKAAGEQAGMDFAEGFAKSSQKDISKSIGDAFNDSSALNSAKESGKKVGDAHASGIKESLGDIDVSDVGDKLGDQLGDAGEGSVRRAGGRIGGAAQSSLGDAGDKGGSAFNRALYSKFADASVAASKAFTTIFAMGNIAGTGIAGLVSMLSALVSGLYAIVSAAGAAAGALAVLPGLMGVALQAGGALKLAFSGVGGALKAGLKPATAAVKQTAATAVSNANAVADAQRALGKAQEAVGRATQDAASAMAAANRTVADAHRDAAASMAAANRSVADASRDVADAEQELLNITKQLNVARQEAAESLQQLGFSAEDAALAEQRAGLRLEDAYAALQAVQNLPPDAKARREAELSYKETELAYRQAKDRNSDLAKESEKAAKAGIEGSDEVLDVQKQIGDAKQALGEKEQALADARVDRENTQLDNARSIADAELARTKTQIANARSISDAQSALTQAQLALARAHQKQGAAAAAATPAVDAFGDAMDKLSKPAQVFVKYLISIKDRFDDLKAAIGAQLFPKLQTSIEKLLGGNMLPQLERELAVTGGLLGDMALGIASVFEKGSKNRFGQMLRGNNEILAVFTERGKGGENVMGKLVRVIMRLFVAIQPVTLKFAEWIAKMIRGWEVTTRGEKGMNRLITFFNKAGNRAALLGRIFGNLFGILGGLSKAADPAGKSLLVSFEEATRKLEKFIKTPEQQKVLQKFFEDAADNFRDISDLLVTIGDEFLQLGDNRGAGKFAKSLEPAVKNFGDMADQMTTASPQLGKFIEKLSIIAKAFADTKGIEIFFKVLNGALDIAIGSFKLIGDGLDKLGDSIGIDDLGKKTFIWGGALLAGLRALSFVGIIGKKVFQIIIGGPINALRKVKSLIKGIGGIGTRMTEAGTQSTKAMDKIDAGKFRRTIDQLKARIKSIVPASATAAEEAEAALNKIGANPKVLQRKGTEAGRAFVFGLNTAIRESGTQFTQAVSFAINQSIEMVRLRGTQLAGHLITGLNAGIKEHAPKIGPVLSTAIGTAAAAVRAKGVTLGAPLITGLNAGIREAGTTIGPVVAAQVNKASPLVKAAGNKLGVSIATGLAAGMRESSTVVKAAVTALTAKVVAAAKASLGIASPSTIFAKLGRQSGTGFVVGIEAEIPAARIAGRELGLAAAAGARSVPVTPNVAAAGAARVATSKADRASGATGMRMNPDGSATPFVGGAPKVVPPAAIPAGAAKKVGILGKTAGAAGKGVGGLTKGLGALSAMLIGVSLPVAAVIAALVGLFFFFKALYKHSPAFKKFVDGIVDKFKDLGKWIGKIFIEQVFPTLNRFFRWVNEKMPAIKAAIGAAIDAIAPILGVLGQIFKVVFTIIKFYIMHIFIPYWKLVWQAIKLAWAIIKPVLGLLWSAIKAVFMAVKWYITNIFVPYWAMIWKAVKGAWEFMKHPITSMKAGFQSIWEKVKNVGNSIKGKWVWVKTKFGEFKTAIGLTIDTVKSKFGEILTKVTNTVTSVTTKFGEFKTAVGDIWTTVEDKVDNIKDKFGEIPAAVAAGFTGLKAKAGEKLQVFVDFLNDKLIDNINKVTTKFGLTIGHIPKVFAEGGWTGPGSKYEVAGLVHADEHVIKAVSRRNIERTHPGALDYMNKTGMIPGSAVPMGDWGPLGAIVGTVTNKAKGAWNSFENLAKTGVGKVMENMVDGAKALMKGAGIKRGMFLNDFFYAIMDKLAAAAKDWGASKQSIAKEKATPKAVGGNFNVAAVADGSGHVSWKGGTFTRTFVAHMKAAEKLANVAIHVTQGGFRPATSYSGTSHQGDALDTQVSAALIRALRRVGIAAGDRTGLGNWAPHVHAIPGPGAGKAAGSAVWQWSDYMAKGGMKQGLGSPWGLALGGVVRATPGGILARIAEGGRNERVEPLALDGFSSRDRAIIDLIRKTLAEKRGGKGDTFHIHPSPGMNEAALAQMVSRRVAWKRSVGT